MNDGPFPAAIPASQEVYELVASYLPDISSPEPAQARSTIRTFAIITALFVSTKYRVPAEIKG
jgi:hypothetical protein